MDDPYWREFMVKNSRRQDIWRTPSMYAWTYKKHGIIGEIINLDSIRHKYEQATGKML